MQGLLRRPPDDSDHKLLTKDEAHCPLPIVGIWMLTIELALLAHDIPTMRRPMARLLHVTNRKIEKWKS